MGAKDADAGAPRTVAEARDYFPRGLSQPATGYRFSLDALLLAEFATLSGVIRVADLGCGCGVIGLALLLRQARARTPLRPGRELHVTGIDQNPEMIACALENAARLGFDQRYAAVQADVAALRGRTDPAPESVDLVVCNPPYRDPASGRRSPDPGRDAARFETVAPGRAFMEAASLVLKNRKRACCIGLAERTDALLADAASCRLTPKRLRFVHPRPGDPARLVLLELAKNGGPGLLVEPPLTLHQAGGTRLTDEALTFCPALACNA